MYAALPMTFEANNGQTDPRVKFLSRAPGYTLFLTDQEAVLSLPAGSPGSASARTGQNSRSSPSPHLKAPEAHQPTRVVRLKFAGRSAPIEIAGSDPLLSKTNYFIGKDPKQWHTNVPNYAGVEYRDIYPGVNATFHGDNRRLEFDFNVEPGADPSAIALEIQGSRGLRVNRAGDLVLQTDARREVVLGKPHVYQQSPGGRRDVAGNFVLRGRNHIGFSVAAYDHSQPLVIDPTLAYSTYLGGSVEDSSQAIAVDSSGSAYITGWTFSADFPTTTGAYQTSCVPNSKGACKNQTAFVSKLSADGSSLVYSTFLNGQTGSDSGWSIAVDSSNDAVVLGAELGEMDFPTTAGVIQPTCNTVANRNEEVFVAKLNPNGNGLVYSTCLQGSTPNPLTGNTGETLVGGIALDGDGNAYVTGNTSEPLEFPTTSGAFQTTCEVQVGGDCDAEYDPFVVKIDPTGENLLYSTFLTLGASPTAVSPTGIAVDSMGNAYVVGDSDGYSLITTSGSVYPVCPGTVGPNSCNGFVLKLSSDGSSLDYSTYLGGSDYANPVAVAVDQNGEAYVAGYTESTDFPTTAGALQYYFTPPGAASANLEDGFIVKLTASGSAYSYSTFLGGTALDTDPSGIALDAAGDAFVTGYTFSGFPTTPNAYQTSIPAGAAGPQAFFCELDPGGDSLLYSTFLAGTTGNVLTPAGLQSDIAVDSYGNAYVIGVTASNTFPITAGAYEPNFPMSQGGPTGYVAKFSFAPALNSSTAVLTSSANPSVFGQLVTFMVTVSASSPGTGTPSGTLTFEDGMTALGVAMLNPSGMTIFATSALSVGSHSITAVYSGDANFNGTTSTALAQTVTKASTVAAMTPSVPNPSVFGQVVTFTAAVAVISPGAGTPTGSVTFFDGGQQLGSGTLISGVATFPTSALSASSHSITAVYDGDPNFNSSNPSTALMQTVNKASTVAAMAPSVPNPSLFGQVVTFTAAVTVLPPGAGTPTGSVTFFDGGQQLGSGTLISGVATFPTSALSASVHSITAVYDGDPNFSVSNPSTALTQTVNPSVAPTITTASLVSGEVGLPYSATIMASGGITPYKWSATGLPAGLTFNSTTGAISGTPTVAGTIAVIYEVMVTVTDSNGQIGSRTYPLTINPKPTLTLSAITANLLLPRNSLGVSLGFGPINGCNSTYNGVSFSNLTVSAGQNCTLVNGVVSGNVQLNGGNLILTDSQVGGNVVVDGGNLILGGSQIGGNVQVNGFAVLPLLRLGSTNITFTIGPGSTITGSLQILGLPPILSGSVQNQVCGTTIRGGLQFQDNATAVLIGSANPASCAGNVVASDLVVQSNSAITTVVGNTVSGNLQDQGNTGPTQVYNNTVTGNLQCQSNMSITEGGNTVTGQQQGQCAPPGLAVSQSAGTLFTYVLGTTSPQIPLAITSQPSGVPFNIATSATLSSSVASGTTPDSTLEINVNTADAQLAPGQTTGTVTVSVLNSALNCPAAMVSTVNGQSVCTVTATYNINVHSSFFQGETPLGSGGFYNLSFFGDYSYFPNQLAIYHTTLGDELLFTATDANRGIYFYDYASGHIWYTNPADYPNIYDFTLNQWLYYETSTGNGTAGSRQFYDYTTGKFITF